MTGWTVDGIAKKFTGTFPALQEVRARAQADLRPAASSLLQASRFADISRNEIRPRVKTFGSILRCSGGRISRTTA